jgi:RimJ/RimL family protein N-acetyltransferase
MFVRTERLLLRPGWIEEAPTLAAAIGDEAVARNLASVPFPYAIADAEAFLSHPADTGRPALQIFARTGRGTRLIGGVGLHRAPGASGDVELGYWIARPYWGLGFATEAGHAMVALGHHSLRLKRIVASHFIDNPASGRVLRKLGFRPTGATGSRYSAGRGGETTSLLFARDVEDDVPAPDMRALAA